MKSPTSLFSIIIALGLALAGCSKPASVGSGSESKSGADVSSKTSFLSKIGFGHSAKASVSFPATGLIAEAIFKTGELSQIGHTMRVLPTMFLDAKQTRSGTIKNINIFDPARVTTGRETYESLLKLQGPEREKVFASLDEIQRTIVDAIQKNDTAKADRLIALQLARAPIAIALAPFSGWEVDPSTEDFFTKRPIPGAAIKLHTYLTSMEASAEFSSLVLADLAGKLSSDVWADPDEAKREIRRIFYAQDPAALSQLWTKLVGEAEQHHRVLNLSSTQRGVDWQAGDAYFSGQSTGLQFLKAGQTWLGDGFLAGKKYQVGLESSYSKATEDSSGGEKSMRASSGTGSSTSAQPK